MYIRILLIVSMMTIISACSQPVLDASDEKSLDRSFEVLVESFPPKKQLQVVRHFTRIRSAYVGHTAFRFEGENKYLRIRRWLDALDGMNAQQISEESERVQQVWILGRMLGARKELQDYQEVTELLNKVSLVSLELIPLEEPSNQARIEAIILNDTRHTIYAAKFSADLLEKNGEFSSKYQLYFQIPDGINPGEQRRVTAYSNLRAYKNRANPPFVNLNAIELYDAIEENTENIIATTRFSVLPSIAKVKKIEDEYRSKYGDDEPSEWSENIKRAMAKNNMFRGY